jgi:Domain of unknown function (DUF932)
MDTSYSSAFEGSLPVERLQHQVPAAFADAPHPRVSPKYLFISTSAVIDALMSEGFVPVNARQTKAREEDRVGFARHMIRFRHPRKALSLREAVPELVLINAHDGTSYYQLRAGLYRPLCTNGLIARLGDFGVVHVPHRGNIIANVVEGAHQIMRGFENIGEAIERMAVTLLTEAQRMAFAEAAVRIRYREGEHVPYAAGRLLEARRDVDHGDDVWHVYNVVQENMMRGGIVGASAKGRATRTRSIRAIQEDVRINTELWGLATRQLRG